MLRKAYVPGTAALLAALLAGCTSGSGEHTPPDNANPGEAGTATVAAQPGKYRTLPEPCGAVDHDTLDALLPGIQQIPGPDQQEKAYQGEATLTYDTDRKVGCRWKVESPDATDRLSVDFERVVSYDNAVSDDDQAERLFLEKQTAADLPAPSGSSAPPASPTPTGSASGSPSTARPSSGAAGSSASADSAQTSAGATPADLQSRALTDLGDEAYLDDRLGASGSTAEPRTVTVVFRTSNVVVTIQYEEQPMATGTVPDSKEMQDRARNLASQLADALNG
ncbi:DUF3558 domain-containing protein [Streptomyces actinomycinicus]|uniref:DUF3558 domain-containing protein n=1 Tax=Streptomyces actinomycinicus TaxID=1695166 RepID=A0A937EFN7_9ACTN|nr:DUF3558 domain-containing protein [Streptomyces actinomycinicus]MBL1081683.1 DUF3558 domain-containing protein [Streptomyces actinomycinicus]